MYDLFGASNEATKTTNRVQHSLAGLILLEQTHIKFQKEPQGTLLQMKNTLLAEIHTMVTNVEFSLYRAETY